MGGTTPQFRHAKARKFQDPERCTTVLALWEALPAWEHLGEEVQAAGFNAPYWVKVSALEKLVPLDILNVIVGRPELDTFAKKLHWVRSQMEHARGANQARAVAGLKDPSGDVQMPQVGAVGEGAASPTDTIVWNLQEECSRCALAADWDGVSAATTAIQALSKGKGKGKKGQWGKTVTWEQRKPAATAGSRGTATVNA